jgi:acyl-homoserine lactone acylase PvdQ
MKQLQLNQKDEFLCEVLPTLLGRLTRYKYIWGSPATEVLFNKLIGWDCVMDRKSVEASIYHVFEHVLLNSLLTTTALSEQERTSIITHAFFENYYFNLLERFGQDRLEEDDRTVCLSTETAKLSSLHSCEAAIALAFKNVPAQLKEEFGHEDIEQYQWGTIHNQKYAIIPFTEIPLINKVWNRNFPVGGNSRTLNVAIFVYPAQKFTSFASPAFRFITDMNTTYYSLETGQSDRVLSPFYDKFVDKNIYLEYRPCNPYQEGLPATWHWTTQRLDA